MKNIPACFAGLMVLAIHLLTNAAWTQDAYPKSVTLTNLYDAFGFERPGLKQDFGFSTLIQYGNTTILFDAGTDARIFQQNVESAGIDLATVDVAIVSHGHYDHIGGFDYLLSKNPNVKIYLPYDFNSLGAPTAFPSRDADTTVVQDLPKEMQYFGGKQTVAQMLTVPTGRFWQYQVEYITEPTEVLPGVNIVPTTSTLMGTFSKYPPHEEEASLKGMPELSLSLATGKGEIVVSGCSHSSIESIIQAVARARQRNIHLVTGGFHLIPYGKSYIEALVSRMKNDYGVAHVAPAHCTGHLGFQLFKKIYGANYHFFGLGEKIRLP